MCLQHMNPYVAAVCIAGDRSTALHKQQPSPVLTSATTPWTSGLSRNNLKHITLGLLPLLMLLVLSVAIKLASPLMHPQSERAEGWQ